MLSLIQIVLLLISLETLEKILPNILINILKVLLVLGKLLPRQPPFWTSSIRTTAYGQLPKYGKFFTMDNSDYSIRHLFFYIVT